MASDLAPAALFLALYLCYWVLLVYMYATKQATLKSRWTFILFHVTLRIAGQICGIGFAVVSWAHFNERLNWLIAYLVMSAEGYFSLVLCAYRFLIVWQNLRLGESAIEPHVPKGTPFWHKITMLRHSPMAFVHYALIAANSIIIAGGSMLSNAMSQERPDPKKVSAGKAMRVVGTAIFLALVQYFMLAAIQSYRRKGDRTLAFIMLVWPLLTVRGVYGIISVVVKRYSYYNFAIYTDSGISTSFLAAEYCLATAMEWLACGLLLATNWSVVVGGEVLEEKEKTDKWEGEPMNNVDRSEEGRA